jgi:hypothetical protein
MKGLCIDGPNCGLVVHMEDLPNKTRVFKVLDPNQPSLLKVSDDDLGTLKINTYYQYPTNPFAQAYGFDALYRWVSLRR